MARTSLLTLAILPAIVAVAVYFAIPEPSTAHLPAAQASIRTQLRNNAPRDLQAKPAERWLHPVADPSMQDTSSLGPVRDFFKEKRWSFVVLDSGRYYVGLAFVHLRYVGQCFVYVIDRDARDVEQWSTEVLRPLAVGIEFAPSSTRGCSTSGDNSMCFDSASQRWVVSIDDALTRTRDGATKRWRVSFSFAADESMVLNFPFTTGDFAYVHKVAGSPARGRISVDGITEELAQAWAGLDWTWSRPPRVTRWKWTFINSRAVVRSEQQAEELADVGVNLSADVYDIDGESMENALWINGKVTALPGVRFHLPQDPLDDVWRIRSVRDDGAVVALDFVPRGARQDYTHLGLVVSDFVQPYGYFNGSITATDRSGVRRTVVLQEVFGVVENHYAMW